MTRLVHRKGVAFHQNNSQLRIEKVTSQNVEFGWEKIPRLLFFPDLASSDYHLFGSLQNYLNGLTLKNHKEVKTDISRVLLLETERFFFISGTKKLVINGKKL